MTPPLRFSRRRRRRFAHTLVGIAALGIAPRVVAQPASSIPSRLSDRELWQLNSDFSEPNGYFRSDNFLSNETGFQFVIPDLVASIRPGGVYLGVGPEQNFTYIAALKPKIAIILDIRRGNMMAHLMYKALFELSADRAEFLSRLFSRPRPPGLDSSSTAKQLFDAYIATPTDLSLYRTNLAAIKKRLIENHGFAMSDSDSKLLDYTFSAYFSGGPLIDYTYPRGFGGFGGGGFPTYASLQQATDSAGKNWAYLANESTFRWLKDFESRNLLVPVVGDFAGPKAIRSIAQWLKARNAVVSAFYTSNVEQYLFMQGSDWDHYYKNVATLPLDSNSSFIRSIGGGRGMAMPPRAAMQQSIIGGRNRAPSVTSSIQGLLRAFAEGRISVYADVIAMSR
ncbi:MAG TPA: hypothetical protein VH559_15870 [Gemmatimonadaceae bacterium]